jgi:hypothetical protein
VPDIPSSPKPCSAQQKRKSNGPETFYLDGITMVGNSCFNYKCEVPMKKRSSLFFVFFNVFTALLTMNSMKGMNHQKEGYSQGYAQIKAES